MTRAARLFLVAVSLAALPSCNSSINVADDANWQRLRSIPRDQRLLLADKLKQFDALDRTTQASVRKLDARLAELPENERANYLGVLRRYHLWIQGLSETQKAEIAAAPPEGRMSLVSRIASEKSTLVGPSDPFVLRLSAVGDQSPFDQANVVRVWLALSPAEKTEVTHLEDAARQRKLNQLGHERKIASVPRPAAADDDAAYERAMKKGLSGYVTSKKKDDSTRWARAKSRMLDHFSFVENPPDRVTSENLARFSAALPPWVRSQYDPLPPDEARRRLTILYRLVFPRPREYVEPRAPAPAKQPAAPTAPAKSPTNTTPF